MKHQLKAGFGERLKEERKRIGLTQVQLAEIAGVKRVTQYLYEKEMSVPNYRYLEAISDAGVDIGYLLFGTREPEMPTLSLTPAIAREIYRAVDTVGKDDRGDVLPVETRMDIFSALCIAYSGRTDDEINFDALISLAKKSA